MGQSVRTVDTTEAVRWEDSPVAVMSWPPGSAHFGTLTRLENTPVGSALALARGWVSKVRSTTSEGPNPAPVTVTLVAGGPNEGETWIAAALGLALAMTEPAARMASANPRVRRRLLMGCTSFGEA